MTSRILPVIAGFSLALTPMLIPASAQVDLSEAPARLSLQVAGDPAGANCRPIVIAQHVPLIPVAMHLTFHDDFNEHPLSNGKWTPHYAGGAAWPDARYWGGDGSDFKRKTSANGEQQIYVDPRYAGRGTTPRHRTLNAMLDAEADQLCGAGLYERIEARQDTRAGS